MDHNVLSVPRGNKRLRLELASEMHDADDESEELSFGRSLPTIMRRSIDGEFVRICIPLRKYPDRFFQYFGMSVFTFDYILDCIRDDLIKYSKVPSVSPAEQLAFTLRHLSTGVTCEDLGLTFIMDSEMVEQIVCGVCDRINEVLTEVHMPRPTRKDFLKIAELFKRLWQFPNCLGALGGKHIRPEHGFTQLKNYDIVMQAIVDANLRFLYVDIGSHGALHDGGTITASPLMKFISDPQNLPPDRFIEGMDVILPQVFVSDDAYPLKRNLMRPFTGDSLTREQSVFNARLSRARRCFEYAFYILVNKWRIVSDLTEASEEMSRKILNCTAVLHNVIIDREGTGSKILKRAMAARPENEPIMRASMKTGKRFNRSSRPAIVIRDCFKDYFNSPAGSVKGQNRHVK